jgi:hypothetical protein
MMCIHTYRGALRVEQQLSGRSVIVPQGVDVMLANGQIDELRNGAGQCKCELQIARIPPAAGGSDTAANSNEAVSEEKPEPREEPIYTVIMPPLEFEAKAKVQPEPDMRLMTIVRHVRVRPALVFQGRVEGEAAATAASTTAPPKPPVASAPAKPTTPAQGSIVDRMRSFFRKLWS